MALFRSWKLRVLKQSNCRQDPGRITVETAPESVDALSGIESDHPHLFDRWTNPAIQCAPIKHFEPRSESISAETIDPLLKLTPDEYFDHKRFC